MKQIYIKIAAGARGIIFCLLFLLSYTSFSQTYTKSGIVYEDYNGNRGITAGEPGTNAGNSLSVYLINNTTNIVLQALAVNADGSYSFTVTALSGANYIVGIGNSGISTGTVFTGGTAAYNSFLTIPNGWSIVDPGDNLWKTAGNGNNTVNNFFIRKLPTAGDVQSQNFPCTPSGCVAIPALNGVAATGNSAYAIDNYKIITIPAGGTLKSGATTISVGQTITAAQGASLCFQKTVGFTGNVSFTYVAIDNAGNSYLSDTAQYLIRLGGASFRRDVPSSILLACNTQPTTLFAPFTGDTTGYVFTYSWTGPAGFSSTLKAPVLAANAAVEDGLYILSATDQNGCVSKDTLKTKKMTCFASCDGGNAYMVKGSGSTNADKLYQYNLVTKVTTIVSSTLTSMDAVCYNYRNNLIYGWAEGNSPVKHIYAMDIAGKQVDLGVSADASSFQSYYFAGTAAPDGRWYMATGQGDAVFKVMDMDPLSPTYMRSAGQINASGGTFDPWDFAWSQCDSMVYGVSGTQLYKMNPVTGAIIKYNATIPGGQGSYGAEWMDYKCDLYISDSQTGDIFKTSLATAPTGTVVFTLVSAGPTGSYNDATINPNQPSDFGDAPASYGQARHKFDCAGGVNSEKVYLGNSVDYESGSIYSDNAKGDDNSYTNSSVINDEDGVTFPAQPLSVKSNSYSVTVSAFRNASLATAPVIYGWVDFNRNGVFENTEFASAVVNLTGSNNYTLTWTGLSCGNLPPGKTYCRFRVTTAVLSDNAATTSVDERASGVASDGEVEDYSIQIFGADYGDAPVGLYGIPVSLVYADVNNDNVPNEPTAIWLGATCQAADGADICTSLNDMAASADDSNGINDEDGFVPPSIFLPGNNTISFIGNGNTHGQTGYYGIWIDWNTDGFQNTSGEFYSGSFTVGSPVTINKVITAPSNISTLSQIYIRIRASASPLGFSDYNAILVNSETEDYFKPASILQTSFINFNVKKQGTDALLSWQTSSEINNAGFNVQHSIDGINWQTLTFINSAGNPNSTKAYSYVHLNPSPGIHFYRLQQVEDNGQYTYTAIQKLIIDSREDILVYPNPVKENIYIQFDKHQYNELEIFNTSGQLVLKQKNIISRVPINVTGFKNGLYMIRISFKDELPFYSKFVKGN